LEIFLYPSRWIKTRDYKCAVDIAAEKLAADDPISFIALSIHLSPSLLSQFICPSITTSTQLSQSLSIALYI
jgi:hypothetical protein